MSNELVSVQVGGIKLSVWKDELFDNIQLIEDFIQNTFPEEIYQEMDQYFAKLKRYRPAFEMILNAITLDDSCTSTLEIDPDGKIKFHSTEQSGVFNVKKYIGGFLLGDKLYDEEREKRHQERIEEERRWEEELKKEQEEQKKRWDVMFNTEKDEDDIVIIEIPQDATVKEVKETIEQHGLLTHAVDLALFNYHHPDTKATQSMLDHLNNTSDEFVVKFFKDMTIGRNTEVKDLRAMIERHFPNETGLIALLKDINGIANQELLNILNEASHDLEIKLSEEEDELREDLDMIHDLGKDESNEDQADLLDLDEALENDNVLTISKKMRPTDLLDIVIKHYPEENRLVNTLRAIHEHEVIKSVHLKILNLRAENLTIKFEDEE